MIIPVNDMSRSPASENLELALVELLQKKAYKCISVSELSELAGVSRQAFYLNYRDKDALLSRLLSKLFADIMGVVDSMHVDTVESLVSVYTEIVEKHSGFMKILADNDLGAFLNRAFVDELVKRAPVLDIQKEPESRDERLYINSFWVSAFTDVYTVWLKNGMQTPKDELNSILADIMTGRYFSK